MGRHGEMFIAVRKCGCGRCQTWFLGGTVVCFTVGIAGEEGEERSTRGVEGAGLGVEEMAEGGGGVVCEVGCVGVEFGQRGHDSRV